MCLKGAENANRFNGLGGGKSQARPQARWRGVDYPTSLGVWGGVLGCPDALLPPPVRVVPGNQHWKKLKRRRAGQPTGHTVGGTSGRSLR